MVKMKRKPLALFLGQVVFFFLEKKV